MSADVVEAEYRDEDAGREIAIRQPISLVPQTTAGELVQRLDVIRGAMQQAMQKDIDYGVIPGTGKKPTLLKPGAEKLAVLFQLDVQLANEKLWGDDGHLTVISRATVFHIPTGARVASGEGICTTREGKYAFRQSERVCPTCGVAAIIKGKAEYGGGWVCFKRKGGCGAKYGDADQSIVGQPTGQVPNPNIADTYNTVDKMASKRARVDAVLAATGASALFTQDVEDTAGDSQQTAQSADPVSPAVNDREFPPVDANGEIIEPGSRPVISEAQRTRLWTIATDANVPEPRLRELVHQYAGVESTKLIPRDCYDPLCEAVIAEVFSPPEETFEERAARAQATRDAES